MVTSSNVRTVSAATACELADVSESRHLKWMHEGIVSRPARKGEYALKETLELAVAAHLARWLKRLSWVRMAMSDLAPGMDSLPEAGPLAVVWERRYKKCQWAEGDQALADFARRHIWTMTLDMRTTIDDVAAAFARHVNAKQGRPNLKVVVGRKE